jgi:hypothetical protein
LIVFGDDRLSLLPGMSRRLPVFFVGDQLIGLGTGFFDELGQRLDLFLCGKDGGGEVD